MTTDPAREKVASQKELASYAAAAQMARAFADPVRLEIIEALAQSARSVESLASICGLPEKNISYHLQRLRITGLVAGVALGRQVIYSLVREEAGATWILLRALAEGRRAGEQSWDRSPARSRQELLRLLQEKAISLIDVRPPEEYAAGHLPGALNCPLSELTRGLPDLPRELPVVAYCRGPYCKLADQAVSLFLAAGYSASRFADGVLEWRQAGLAIVPQAEGIAPPGCKR